ncbi:hypothetical protein ONZ45_g14812 [Pleurotus djamor]|nr:hypothetical protein ONZ45_g14812 [Pleurotus djamor]
MKAVNASFVKESAVTQHPSFMFLGCSDSRVSEGNIFNTQPGVIFAGRNVAAQYVEEDDNEYERTLDCITPACADPVPRNSVLLYAIHHLNVAHIIVMGHYGCGGVAAAISSTMKKKADAKDSIDRWIWPIRELYLNSKREEIVALRNTHKKRSTAPSPPDDPVYNAGYRALVEENVKANVDRIVKSKAAKGTHNPKVQIYGWVYDVATLDISDLEVTRTLG